MLDYILGVGSFLVSAGGFITLCVAGFDAQGNLRADVNQVLVFVGFLALVGGIILGVWTMGRMGMFGSYGPHSR